MSTSSKQSIDYQAIDNRHQSNFHDRRHLLLVRGPRPEDNGDGRLGARVTDLATEGAAEFAGALGSI
jgi:hypothetical protein